MQNVNLCYQSIVRLCMFTVCLKPYMHVYSISENVHACLCTVFLTVLGHRKVNSLRLNWFAILPIGGSRQFKALGV